VFDPLNYGVITLEIIQTNLIITFESNWYHWLIC
jgi:hypothetical protein